MESHHSWKARQKGRTHVVDISGLGLRELHTITKVNKVLVCTFLLFSNEAIPDSHLVNFGSAQNDKTGNGYPLTPIVSPSARVIDRENRDRLGASWKRI
jgi:hypothetical protein